MDNIEKLISNADPAKRKDSSGPGALDLREPTPTFAQHPRPATRSRRTFGWKMVTFGTAIAAATAGIIVWSPWQVPVNNGPAGPTINVTESPSTGPTTEDGLPNALVPAHSSVYFEDSAACAALDLRTIKVTMLSGIVRALPIKPSAFPVVGCVDGIAAIQTTDLSAETLDDLVSISGTGGILIARWTDGTWSILEKENPGVLNDEGVPLLAWPVLRGWGNVADLDIKPDQEGRIRALGLDEKIIGKLLGPNVASWMGNEASTDFQVHRNTLLSVTHPGWEIGESMWDVDHNDLTGEETKRPDKSAVYIVTFHDSRGKQVFKAMSEKYERQYQGAPACFETATYRLDGESPSGAVADAGPMKLALMTTTKADGSELSRVGLFPADLPATGDDCDVKQGVDVDGRVFSATEWTPYMGFKNQAERDAYVKSPEYTDAKKVASLLTFERIEE